MRIFFLKLLGFLPLLALVVGVCYREDPASLFRGDQAELQLTEILVSGSNARLTGTVNYDERAVQRAMVERLPYAPRTLVIGSSRAMLLSSRDLGTQLLNQAVSGGVLEDFLALSELDRRFASVKRVIVVVDPWLFNAANRERRWQSLAEWNARARTRLGLSKHWWAGAWSAQLERDLQLVSPAYFQESLDRALRSHAEGFQVEATQDWQGPDPIRHFDGSLAYPVSAGAEPDEVTRLAVASAERPPIYGLEHYEQIDETLWNAFQRWLDDQQAQGRTVVLVLAPYHPETYRRLSQAPRYRILTLVEERVRQLAGQRALRLVGSYDPERLGLSGASFYDGYHARPEVLAKLLRGLP